MPDHPKMEVELHSAGSRLKMLKRVVVGIALPLCLSNLCLFAGGAVLSFAAN